MFLKSYIWVFLIFGLFIFTKSRTVDKDDEDFEERVVFPDEFKEVTTAITTPVTVTSTSSDLITKLPDQSIEIVERHFVRTRKNCKSGEILDRRGKCRRTLGKRQIDPNFQYLNFPYQSPETMYPNLNNDPCIKLDVNDRVCPEQQYFGPQYYPQQMATHLQLPGNIIDNPGISSIWSLLYPQILSRQQQHPGYEVLWPYNYQQWIPPLPPAQPTNNEPQTTPHDQATNKSENNLGVATARSAPAVTNPETSSYSQEFDHVQNDPIKYNYQVVKTSASITNPKTVNIVRSFIDSHEVPEIKMREETPSQAPTEEENVDRRENPVDNPSNEENKEENEDGDLSQTDVGRNNLNQDIHNIQVSQQNVQRQENTADNNTDIRANEKNRKPQNQPRNDGENEDEYYYEYLH